MNKLSPLKTSLLTAIALLAFAGNSVLCRLALGEGNIDAGSFTIIRLLSGIAVLFVLMWLTQTTTSVNPSRKGSWRAASMLFLYALGFSYAYISLETGTGALILFGAVQITMIVIGIFSGNRLCLSEWIGVGVAFSGFVYLMLPGIEAPPILGFLCMAVAGIAWGVYTLQGKASRNPLEDTGFNFLRTLPFVLVLLMLTIGDAALTSEGIILAILSGGVASGIGYSVWYMALSGLSGIQAAVLQLLVPVIATLGGVLFSGEDVSLRFGISTLMVLGGILLVVFGRYRQV